MDEEKQAEQFDEVRCPAHYAGDGEVDSRLPMNPVETLADAVQSVCDCAIEALRQLANAMLRTLRRLRKCLDPVWRRRRRRAIERSRRNIERLKREGMCR